MRRDQLEELFSEQAIVDLCSDLWLVMQAWDDAVDGDEADHAEAYKAAMIRLPTNPHYSQCVVPLLVSQAYYDWQVANKYEKERRDLEKAFILRAGYYRILISISHIIYGTDHTELIAAAMWDAYGEDFEEYKREVLNA